MHTSIFFYSQGTGGVFIIFVLEWKERDKILSVVFFPLFEAVCGQLIIFNHSSESGKLFFQCLHLEKKAKYFH